MSWQASSWALKQRVGDPILKVLLLAISNYADPDGRCWPSIATLTFDSEVSKRTIQRKMQDLQQLGLIVITPRHDGGRQISSIIQLQMDEGCQKVTPDICHGEGDSKVSPPNTLNNQKNKQLRPAKPQDGVYDEEFEALWKQYPRTKNTSKKKAHDLWRMMNDVNQKKVRAAVPIFAAAMRAEGRPEDKIPYMTSWLNGKTYETVAAPAGPTAPPVERWKTATHEEWAKLLKIWRMDNNWRQTWGPEPGKPGCCVPDDLLTENEKWLISQSRVPKNTAQAAE